MSLWFEETYFENEEKIMENLEPLREQAYICKDNYLIEYDNNPSDLAVIYFTSNGMYEDNETDFYDKVINHNRFEWYKSRIMKKAKHIFVRDVYKGHYLKGINAHLNSQDKLGAFLKKETLGKRIITIGSSAGGYAAVLFGQMLDADYIISLSGQFFIKDETYNLKKLMQEHSRPVYYFLPYFSRQDLPQYEYVKGLENLFCIKVAASDHVLNFPHNLLVELINMESDGLKKLSAQTRDVPWSIKNFIIKVIGRRRMISAVLLFLMKNPFFWCFSKKRKEFRKIKKDIGLLYSEFSGL